MVQVWYITCSCLIWLISFFIYPSAATPVKTHEKQNGSNHTNVSLRILSLGASITWGTGSSTGNGYRKDLRNQMLYWGFEVDMVGSKSNGDMLDNAVEAHPGDTIDQIKRAAANSVGFKPNVVLINAGTNDCRLLVDVKNAVNRLKSLIEYLWSAPDMKNSLIVVSTLLHSWQPNVAANQPFVNEQYRDLVKTMRGQGLPIVLAEMDPPGVKLGESWHTKRENFADDTHPNDKGYTMMAAEWSAAILDAYNRKLIPSPAATNSAYK